MLCGSREGRGVWGGMDTCACMTEPLCRPPETLTTLFVNQLLLLLLSHFSRVRLLATSWTAAYQAPLSTGLSRQEYWSGVPLPSPLLIGYTPTK